MFVLVHGGVCGVEEMVSGGAVFRIEGDADGCGAVEEMAFDEEWFVKAVLDALGDFFDVGAGMYLRNEGCELIASEAGKHIDGTELALHPGGDFLKIEISNEMAAEVVDLLELIEIDIDEAEDGCVIAGFGDEFEELLIEGEAVVDVGKLVKV